ncbi:MAG: Trp biosynthesis-associated membrane protein [Actinomycetota bacterium]
MERGARRGTVLAAVLAAAGGAAVAVGSTMDWATVAGRRQTAEVNGALLYAGITVACGLVALSAGLLALSARRGRTRGFLAAAVLAAGLASAGIGVAVASSDEAVLTRLAESSGRPGAYAGRGRRAPDVDPAAGLYLVIVGGVLAAAGGVSGLVGARERTSGDRILDRPPAADDTPPTPA